MPALPVINRAIGDDSALQDLGRDDLYAEAGQADIVPFARRQKPDGGNAQVAQDLRPEADFAPFVLAAKRFIVRLPATRGKAVARSMMADADRSFPQIDDDAALVAAHFGHQAARALGGTEDGAGPVLY